MSDSDGTASADARWRNYQHLLWTQQQIHLQIQQQQQQQQMQSQKMSGLEAVVDNLVMSNQLMSNQVMNNPIGQHGLQQPQLPAPGNANKPLEEKAQKGDGTDLWDNFDAQAAFLGPSLWDKKLPYDGQDFKLEYVDLEEFLTENGIPLDTNQDHSSQFNANNKKDPNNALNGNGMQVSTPECSPPVDIQQLGQFGGAGPSRNQQGLTNIPSQNLMRGPSSLSQSENSRSPSPCGSTFSHSSDEDSMSTVGDEQNGELGLAIPGRDFDPRTRSFTEDELKPQPMIKKSRKQFVPEEQKDAKYWARRRKNNMAAKRSRDARRVKENQIAMRACFLEKQNTLLKQEFDRIQKENIMLKEQLNCCRRDHSI